MAYCRFSNTLSDLRDCVEALSETNGTPDELSPEERKAAKKLILLCDTIAEDWLEVAEETK